jgi:hypothetical protein
VSLLLPRGGQLCIRSGRMGDNNPIESESEGDGRWRVLWRCGERVHPSVRTERGRRKQERKEKGEYGKDKKRKKSGWMLSPGKER